MDTQSIYSKLKNNPITQNSFEDVYAADKLLLRQPCKKTKFIVVNLDPSWEGGSHWVAMMINNRKPCEYFDSYGKKPPYSDFEHILNQEYYYNPKQLQHNLTTSCGQWAMLYIWDRSRGCSFHQFLNRFNKKDFLLNDHMVNQAVKSIFKTKTKVIDKKFLCQQICKSLKRKTCVYYPHRQKCKMTRRKKKKRQIKAADVGK